MSEKLRHLQLHAREALFARPSGGSKGKQKPFTSHGAFKSMLTPLLSAISYHIHNKESVYYTIKFHIPYDKEVCQKALTFLKATVKEVVDEYTLIVYSPKDRIIELENAGSLFKYVSESVESISYVDHTQQLGQNLIERMKEEQDSSEEITIVLHETTSPEEYATAKSQLMSIKNLIIEKEYPELAMLTVKIEKALLKDVETLPSVHNIFLKPIATEDSTDSIDNPIIDTSKKITIAAAKDGCQKVCVIDSGCDFKALGLPGKDSDGTGHGTKVASIVCFGNQLIHRKYPLHHETKLVVHKLTHQGEADIIRGIIDAITANKHDCRIYCLSYNFSDMDPSFRKVIAERLDRYLQKQNVIVINSSGNIPWGEVFVNKDNYPQYMSKFDVLCPSECRMMMSVGNHCQHKGVPLPACNSRHGIGKIFLDKPRDEILYQKPELCALGGTINLAKLKEEKGTLNIELDQTHAVPVIDKSQNIVLEAGTSFSAPMVANACAKLMQEYGHEYKNCETFKAMLLNKAEYSLIPGQKDQPPLFTLDNLEDIEYCKDSVYMQFEGEWTPSEQFETRDKKPHVKGHEVKFYVPKGVKTLRVAIFHSNDYPLQKIDKPAVSFVIKVLKPNGKSKSSKYNTLAKPTHLHYGVYTVNNTETDNLWTVQFKIWGYNVPKDQLSSIKVRFGISIRLYPEKLDDLKEIYELVKNEGKLPTHSTVTMKTAAPASTA